ncbi:MAG: SAM-dependent methyltransferase [Alphaproteobacteria bacterium]|nr:SAM-dependent methyltransferase [Alphaproteobacteria bacterium]
MARVKPADDLSEVKTLWPGESDGLLKELHILTRDGRLNQDSRRKLKQVLHLVQLLRPAVEDLLSRHEEPVIADLGAGKSYLGFILYDILLRQAARGRLIGIETRPALSAHSEALAQSFGFARTSFITAPIAEARVAGPVHLVTALHACDTATDDAIAFALAHQAAYIALVPCCQAELARALEGHGDHPLYQLWRHPLHRRECASHLTNVLRGLWLETHGYKIRVTELTCLEHSMKNELILAEKVQQRNGLAERALGALLAQLPARPQFLQAFTAG